MRIVIKLGTVLLLTVTAACATLPGATDKTETTVKQKIGRPYQIGGNWYYPKTEKAYDQVGIASWYGEKFHGAPTANGEIFDMNGFSAAHTTLPLPSWVEVTNLENNKKMVVRVNDRGPFVDGRLIDLSKATARELGFLETGVARVRVRLVDPPDGVALVRASVSDQPVPPLEPEPVRLASISPVTLPPQPPTSQTPIAKPAPSVRTNFVRPVRNPTLDTPGKKASLSSKIRQPSRKPVASTTNEISQPNRKPIAYSAAPDKPTAASAALPAVNRFLVQVATFTNPDNAKQLVSSFDETYSAFISPYSLEDGRILNRVRLGPFESREKAEEALRAATDRGHNDARIFRQRG